MLEQLNQSLQLIIEQTKHNFQFLGIILIVIWSVFFITRFIDNRLLLLGIIPRKLRGLAGIFFSPFLHVNFNHIFFNSIPLIVLSNFILIDSILYYSVVTVLIIFISGLATWCFAKPGLHVGASGLITGYWGLLVSNIFQHGTLTTIMLGLISLYYFAGIFLGVFPGKKGVSWEGHLFGLLAGFFTSYIMSNNLILFNH